MASPQPGIGDWYRLNGGALFEVVALDDDDGTIEIQYFDGTVEEMDIEDWEAQWDDGALESAEAPEDWSGSVDVQDSDGDARRGTNSDTLGEERDLQGECPRRHRPVRLKSSHLRGNPLARWSAHAPPTVPVPHAPPG